MPTFDRPTILMCPPDYFGIEYEINPWMSRSRQSDSQIAHEQWNALHELLRSLNVDTHLMKPQKGMPDLVFTANSGLVWREKVFLPRFRHEARQPETNVDDEWFRDFGLETISLPDEWDFEGAGDALFCDDTLFAGYIIRSDAGGMQWIASEIGCRVIPLQLIDEYYYHLDTCFCPIDKTHAIYFPAAFDEYGQSALREHVAALIEVEPDEAARFACNAIVVGNAVVLNTGCPKLESALKSHGYETHATPLDEFSKAGGSAKCLTLRLDGEEAAIW